MSECKKGASGSRILDGWALLNTWSPLTTIGYEIKRSRSDWVRDQKFLEYRDVCHLLFVVAEKGLVKPGELPAGVGLMEPVGKGDGRRLVTRVKAVRVEPDWQALARLMAYVFMWRQGRDLTAVEAKEQRAKGWREFAEGRVQWQMIGRSVKGRMRVRLYEAIAAQQDAENQLKAMTEAKAALDALGVKPGCWNIRREIERALLAEANDTLSAVSAASQACARLQAELERAVSAQRMDGQGSS